MQLLRFLLLLFIMAVLATMQFPEIFAGFVGTWLGKSLFVFLIICMASVDIIIGLLVTVIFVSLEVFLSIHRGAGRGLGATATPMHFTLEGFGGEGGGGEKKDTGSDSFSSILSSFDNILAAGNIITSSKHHHKNATKQPNNKSSLFPLQDRLMTNEESKLSAMQKTNPNVERFVSTMNEKNAEITNKKLNMEKHLVRQTKINHLNLHKYKTKSGKPAPGGMDFLDKQARLMFSSVGRI